MKENDIIWVSIEESDKYELSNYGFVRNKYTKKEKSFTYIKNNKYKAYCIDDEPFDKNRYAPTKQISVYNRNTNKLLFTGTVGECAKFLGVKPYIINNALRKDNMGVFKFIVINDKIE